MSTAILLAISLCVSFAQEPEQKVIKDLIEKLGSPRIEERTVAEQELRTLGRPALPSLKVAAESTDPEVAGRASKVSAAISQTLERLELLRTAPTKQRQELMVKVREDACTGAGGHPPSGKSTRPDLLPLLQVALEDKDKEVRTQAVCALAYMHHERAFPALEEAVRHRDPGVRYYACMGLEWLGRSEALKKRAIDVLISARDSKTETWFDVRLHAATGLLHLGEKQDAELFIEAMRRDRANHALASGALATLDRKDAIDLMLLRLEKAVPSEDHWLGVALAKLTGQSFGTDYQAWKKWVENHRASLPPQLPLK